jgi:hypothetical protein
MPGAARHPLAAFGTLMTGFMAIALLDAANPDALIVRANAGRMYGRANGEQAFDARYAASLSADAVPALVEALPTMPGDARRTVAAALIARWSPAPAGDWRTWNWGRAQARRAAGANRIPLQEMAR